MHNTPYFALGLWKDVRKRLNQIYDLSCSIAGKFRYSRVLALFSTKEFIKMQMALLVLTSFSDGICT